MHINGIIITKQFISHWNFKRLRGSVGRAHIHFGYIFLKSNEKIVVKNPKSTFFIVFIVCRVILQFIHISHLSKSLSSVLSLRCFRGERTAFSESALMCDVFLYASQLAGSLFLCNSKMVQIVHHSWHLLRVLLT